MSTTRSEFLAGFEADFVVQVECDGPTDYIVGTQEGEVSVHWSPGPAGDWWDGATPAEVRLHVGARLVSTSITDVLTTARDWVAGCTEARPTQAVRR